MSMTVNLKTGCFFHILACCALIIGKGDAVWAQQHLYRQISLHEVQQRPVSEVLEKLSENGKFHFSYRSDRVPTDSTVSLPAFQGTLHDFLVQLLGQEYDFKELSDYVVIRHTPHRLTPAIEIGAASGQALVVQGQVTDANTQQGVANVSIYDKYSLASTLSDRDGHFKLEIKKPDPTVWMNISKENYRDTTLVILMPVEVNNHKLPIIFRYHPGYNGHIPLLETWLGRFFSNSRQRFQQLNVGSFFAERPYQLSLLPGLGTHGFSNNRVFNNVSVNVIGGHGGGVNGVEVSGMFAVNELDVARFQAAGLFNLVGGGVQGVQLAGGFNRVIGSLAGLQVAGLYNAVGKHMKGMQVAGIVNRAETVQGVQLAGLVNIADSSDYPIGLINLVRKGTKSLSLESDDQGRISVNFRSGGRVMYGLVGLGYAVSGLQLPYTVHTGIGAQLVSGQRFGIDTELVGKLSTSFSRAQSQYFITALPHISLTSSLGLYGGPVFGVVTAYENTIVDEPDWILQSFDGRKNMLYGGFNAGIRYAW